MSARRISLRARERDGARRGGISRLLVVAVSLAGAALSCADIPVAPLRSIVVTGSVSTPDGRPVPDASIYFTRTGPGAGRSSAWMDTDWQGRFSGSVAEGIHEVTIAGPEFGGVPEFAHTTVRIDASANRFDYTYGGRRVTGTVTDPAGAVIPNAKLYFYGRSGERSTTLQARVDGAGFLAFVPVGTYSITVVPPSSVDGVPRLDFDNVAIAADTTIDFALTGRRVTGRIFAPDGSPLVAATLWFHEIQGRAVAAFNSRSDGSYEVYVPDGVYEIEMYPALGDRYLMARSFGFLPVAGDLENDLWCRGTAWAGTVRDAQSLSPISGALVKAHQYYGDVNSQYADAYVTTDANGGFGLSLVTGMVHRISVGAAGYRPIEIFPAVSGADSTFDLMLETEAAP